MAYELTKGTLVVFTCSNPAVGYIKRMGKDGSWADVKWISNGLKSNGHTSRVLVKNLRPLNGILNYWMQESGHTGVNFRHASGNFYLSLEKQNV